MIKRVNATYRGFDFRRGGNIEQVHSWLKVISPTVVRSRLNGHAYTVTGTDWMENGVTQLFRIDATSPFRLRCGECEFAVIEIETE